MEDDDRALVALAILGQAIQDPQNRRQLARDPDALESVLRSGGATADDLPAEVRDLFGDLSFEEWRFLARFQQTMSDANLADTVSTGTRAGPGAEGKATVAKL